MAASLPRFLIAGRPNVGKSTLFNRLCGRQKAIVADTPGVTRDMMFAEAEWSGRRFLVVDSGGLLPGENDPIARGIESRVMEALKDVEGVLLVMDAKDGLLPLDEELHGLFRRLGVRNLLVVVNKVDSSHREGAILEFERFAPIIAVSALHGRDTGVLLDWMIQRLDEAGRGEEEGAQPPESRAIRFTVVGRPNVGKSSLVNRLLGYDRMLVDDKPGTTRDAVEIPWSHKGREFAVVDTAGMRRRVHPGEDLEFLAVRAARRAMERADTGVVLMDAAEPPGHQEAVIVGLVLERNAGIVLALNKWDRITRNADERKGIIDEVRRRFRFVSYAPILTVSARTGEGLEELVSRIVRIDEARGRKVPTADLNKLLLDMRVSDQPGADGSWMRIKYITQVGTRPPTFGVFSHARGRLKPPVERRITSRIRKAFGFEGTPIVISYRRS